MKFDITNRWTGSVVFSAEIECAEDAPTSIKLGLAVRLAVKSRANLADANLAGANLAHANLARANLAGANLARANLAHANLADAYLARANLARANNLDRAKWDVNGEIKCTVSPVFFLGGAWPVMVSDAHIKIGCQVHTTEAWGAFSDREIAEMDGAGARRFWKLWKTPILAMAEAHQSRIKDAAKDDI